MKYFEISEFDSPDLPGSGEFMNGYFLKLLDRAREEAGIPFVINSGFRTEEHNRAVGGSLHSSHKKGLAADIRCVDSTSRLIIVEALLYVGFRRIGIAKTFIHVDLDKHKDQDVIWLYI